MQNLRFHCHPGVLGYLPGGGVKFIFLPKTIENYDSFKVKFDSIFEAVGSPPDLELSRRERLSLLPFLIKGKVGHMRKYIESMDADDDDEESSGDDREGGTMRTQTRRSGGGHPSNTTNKRKSIYSRGEHCVWH